MHSDAPALRARAAVSTPSATAPFEERCESTFAKRSVTASCRKNASADASGEDLDMSVCQMQCQWQPLAAAV
jgi:hypothetical protein